MADMKEMRKDTMRATECTQSSRQSERYAHEMIDTNEERHDKQMKIRLERERERKRERARERERENEKESERDIENRWQVKLDTHSGYR